jgi:IBR domain, a half RING-finger domain
MILVYRNHCLNHVLLLFYSQCLRCGGEYGYEKGRRNLACPLCKFSWCLKCQKASHKGQTCQEAAQLNARSHAEDAITAAVVRRCPNPKCNLPFQKGSDNECNKIKCASCGTISCYLCRQEIKLEKPYRHFCRIAHCQHTNCGKCILFTKATEDDERARRQVALAQVQQARAAGHDIETLLSPQRPPPRQAQVATNQAGVPARVVVNQEQPEAQPAVAGRGERQPALVADVPVAAQEVAAGREAPVVLANNQVRGDDPPAHACVIM